MSKYQVVFNPSSREVLIQNGGTQVPEGSNMVGPVFDYNPNQNKALVRVVQDILYHEGVRDMSSVVLKTSPDLEDDTGLVTAGVGEAPGTTGTTKETAQHINDDSSSQQIDVLKNLAREQDRTVDVTRVEFELSDDAQVLRVSETLQLSVKVEPEGATDRRVRFETSDDSVASVDEDGVVRGIKAGKVTVAVASVSNEELMDTFDITVSDAEIVVGNTPSIKQEEISKED